MSTPGPHRPILRAYADETGDRGVSGKSSAFFAFAAVLVADEDEGPLRAAMSKLRADLDVPPGRPLHWKDHVKVFPRRQHVTLTLTAVPGITLVYVVVEKAAIPPHAAMKSDQTIFYNFAAGMVLERVLLAARDWPGGSRSAVMRFGHVKGFDHTTTARYIDQRIADNDPAYVPWHLLSGRIHFDAQYDWDGLQVADQYAGMLSAALRPDRFGNYEPQHLINAVPQIRQVHSEIRRYGFKFLGDPATLDALPWWHQSGI